MVEGNPVLYEFDIPDIQLTDKDAAYCQVVLTPTIYGS